MSEPREKEMEEEPIIYRCESCGKWFDRKVFSHSRTEMNKNGGFMAVECGPITEFCPKEAADEQAE